jgi:PKD repeat protein
MRRIFWLIGLFVFLLFFLLSSSFAEIETSVSLEAGASSGAVLGQAGPMTYFVKPGGTGDCNPVTPCSFQTALDKAATDGEDSIIYVGSGTYNITSTLTYQVSGGDGTLTIEAKDPSNPPVLDGGDNVQIMYINNDKDSIGDGGQGITLRRLVFQRGKNGVMIQTTAADILVEHCQFINNNSSQYGGGLYAFAVAGGGIEIRGNIFRGNTSSKQGGGVYAIAQQLPGFLKIVNNIFENNTAAWSGGGVYLRFGHVAITITNNTFYNNDAPTGGGVYIMAATYEDRVDIYNNIFWANSASTASDLYYDVFSSPQIRVFNNDFSCSDFDGSSSCLVIDDITHYIEGNNISADPLFADPASSDFHLSLGSPCIDTGNNHAPELPSEDFEGDPRMVDGDDDGVALVDMGADEARVYRYYVSPDGSGFGCTEATPCAFQTALSSAEADGADSIIFVNSGTYSLTSPLTYEVVDGDGSLIIEPVNPSNPPVLDGNNSTQIMLINNDIDEDGGDTREIRVRGLVFQNGNNAGWGGGLYLRAGHANILIENCQFLNNLAKNGEVKTLGGGLYVAGFGGSIDIRGNTFDGNSANIGGGMHVYSSGGALNVEDNTFLNNSTFSTQDAYAQGGGASVDPEHTTATISGNTFSNNIADLNDWSFGGALRVWLYNNDDIAVIDNNIFSNNVSEHGGGGIELGWVSGTVRIMNNIFKENSSYNGGGVDVQGSGSIEIINNIFENNSANYGGRGGGIHVDPVYITATITNNTFYTNSGYYGGGVYLLLDLNGDGANIYNNIFWANSANDGDDLYAYVGYSNNPVNVFNNDFSCSDFSGSGSCLHAGGSYSQGNNISADPLFADPTRGDLHLTRGSPCIDAGDNNAPGIPDADFEGDQRVVDGDRDSNAVADMGADEYVPPPFYTLTVQSSGTGSGTVTSDPAGIDCGTDCSETYDEGTVVILTASADANSVFSGWGGDCSGCGTNASCDITMDADKTCTATFEQATQNQPPVIDSFTASPTTGTAPLTVDFTCIAHDPDGSITEYRWDYDGDGTVDETTATGSATHTYTTEGTYTATCTVVDDGGATATSNPVDITVTAPQQTHTLTVQKAGTGSGTVSSSPAGIDCGTDCSEAYDEGTVVTLTATAAADSVFSGWEGDCSGCGTSTTCDVTMDSDKTCTAAFDLQQYTLSVNINPSGGGSVTGPGINCPGDCTEVFDHGTEVTLEATASAGYEFDSWSNCDSITGTQCTVRMEAARAVTANFRQIEDIDGDGVSSAVEDGAPNGGDGNGDGMPDSQQGDVTSLLSATGQGYITVVTTCSQNENVQAFMESPEDPEYGYPFGLVGFELPCSSATVRVYFHGTSNLTGYEYRKYGPTTPGDPATTGWYTLPGVIFGSEEIGGRMVAYAEFSLRDGQLGDDTGVDGRIVDQGGPGQQATVVPTMTEWGMILFMVLAGTVAVWQMRRLRV